MLVIYENHKIMKVYDQYYKVLDIKFCINKSSIKIHLSLGRYF